MFTSTIVVTPVTPSVPPTVVLPVIPAVPLAVIFVKAPVDAELAPIGVPSTAPPFTSIVANTVVGDIVVAKYVCSALIENCFVVPSASLPNKNSVPSMLLSIVYVLILAIICFYLQLFFLVPFP